MICKPGLSFHLREELQLTWEKSGKEATESKHQIQGDSTRKSRATLLLGPGSGQSPSTRELIREIKNIIFLFLFPGDNKQKNFQVCLISALDTNKGFSC